MISTFSLRDHFLMLLLAKQFTYSKVNELRRIAFRNEYVLRLYVSVDNSLVMNKLESRCNIFQCFLDLVFTHKGFPIDLHRISPTKRHKLPILLLNKVHQLPMLAVIYHDNEFVIIFIVNHFVEVHHIWVRRQAFHYLYFTVHHFTKLSLYFHSFAIFFPVVCFLLP